MGKRVKFDGNHYLRMALYHARDSQHTENIQVKHWKSFLLSKEPGAENLKRLSIWKLKTAAGDRGSRDKNINLFVYVSHWFVVSI